MVAGNTGMQHMDATHARRKPLLGRGIADQWVGLLRGNSVRSKAAPGPVRQHRNSLGPSPSRQHGKGVLMRIPIPLDASFAVRSFAPLTRGEAR